MKSLTASIMKMIHVLSKHPEDIPLDKLQMDAAKDRLTQRGEELQEVSDELSKMIRRLKRKDE
jgi:hypothetical protein